MKNADELAEDFAAEFSDFATSYNSESKKLAIQRMLRDHRTCQQSMMRFFMMFVEGMAESRSDLRNEATVELAKEIMKIDSKIRILPHI